MSFDYNLFKKHISSFDYQNYLNDSSTSFQTEFDKFYSFYLKIIKDEIENTKQLNAKFSKNINDKNGKFSKFNRHQPIEFKKVCSFESIDNENERLNIIIRTYLNKFSEETFDKVSEQLIEKLGTFKNNNLFKILSEEIVNKCIFDYKYRNLYINLCSKIWSNKKIHYNLIKINKEDNNYYAEHNINDQAQKYGPFDSIDKLKENIYKKINFKNFFIDFLQDLYYNKNLDFQHLEDQEFFNIKKKTLLLVELLSILFIEKHINFDIINLIIIDLLHQNNNFAKIKEIEFELLHVMIKFIFENNKSFKFIEYKKIIGKFKNILEIILSDDNESQISKRSLYFINEIILMFSKILKNEKHETKKVDKVDINTTFKNIITYAEKGNYDNFYHAIKYIESENISSIISSLINKSLESKKNVNLVKSLKKIKDSYHVYIESTLMKIINNLDDIILDIPDIDKNIENFVHELDLNKDFIIDMNKKLENININNDSDDDEFSFR